MPHFHWVAQLGRYRFGITHDLILEDDSPYLERWILWLGFSLRLHRFHKGDDDRAYHDHPWWFVTFPINTYLELTGDGQTRRVRAFLPHFRPARHRHIVKLCRPGSVWTIIVTGPKSKDWGFWDDGRFIPNSQWLNR